MRTPWLLAGILLCALAFRPAAAWGEGPLGLDGFEEGFADSNGVRIHYVVGGEGPLVVMIHGFPDFWYGWRAQMPALAKHFRVVAIDQRGYNTSDHPTGVANYGVDKLVGDVDAVVRHFQAEKATIVGHDWGGLVAWVYAMQFPDKTQRLVILNLPHPNGLRRELANNPAQRRNSQYARDFQKPDAASKIAPAQLAQWVTDAGARERYVDAFRNSSIEGMLNYYKANYPREDAPASPAPPTIKVRCPVLMFHGLRDEALLPAALNDTWEWIDNDLTLITLPEAGHFVQQDAADKVTRKMVQWLTQP